MSRTDSLSILNLLLILYDAVSNWPVTEFCTVARASFGPANSCITATSLSLITE
jgi:hypothetical protein